MTTPVVLVAHSLLWPNAARLAIACKNAGFSVAAIARREHPLHKMRSPDRTFVYLPHDARGSLRRAIELCRPQLIMPCDDRVVAHLHTLHSEYARAGNPTAKLIETSLGHPDSYEIVRKRSLLGKLAFLPGVRIPQGDMVDSLSRLKAWVALHGLPALLKLDGRTGGQDLILLSKRADLANDYLNMKVRQCGMRALWNAIRRGDVETILSEWRDGLPAMSVQSMAPGRPANCAVACWRGEVISFVAVETVRARSTFGVATLVRRVEGGAMRAAAESIVRHLGISGMCGFDFMIDEDSQEATLVEINPRATQINHFPLAPQADLSTALLSALGGRPAAAPPFSTPYETPIALFPQACGSDAASLGLAGVFHDAPHEEPELLMYYGHEPLRGEQLSSGSVAVRSGAG